MYSPLVIFDTFLTMLLRAVYWDCLGLAVIYQMDTEPKFASVHNTYFLSILFVIHCQQSIKLDYFC
jgi:hypothetical protein